MHVHEVPPHVQLYLSAAVLSVLSAAVLSLVLSAAVANPGAPDPHSGPNCIVLPAPRTGP